MSLSLFKRSTPPEQPPVGPHHKALRKHAAAMAAAAAAMLRLNESSATYADDESRPATCRAEIARARDDMSAKRIAAVVNGTPPEDLTSSIEHIERLEQRLHVLDHRAEDARRVRAELQSRREALLVEYRKMESESNALVLNALVEDLAALHPAYAAAESAYQAALREVFVKARAIDLWSERRQLGFYVDAQRFELRHAPLPKVEPFTPNWIDDTARVEKMHADNRELQRDAEALIASMLKGAE